MREHLPFALAHASVYAHVPCCVAGLDIVKLMSNSQLARLFMVVISLLFFERYFFIIDPLLHKCDFRAFDIVGRILPPAVRRKLYV